MGTRRLVLPNIRLLALICSALAGVGGCQMADERDGAEKSNAAAEVGRPAEPVRFRLSLAADWRWLRRDTPEAADPEFDDSAWESVGVPHSVSHEDAFDELSKTATLAIRDDGKFYWSGVVWYRRNVAVPSGWDGRRLFVEFEGVSQRADVWCNGRKLGTHFGSSAPFLVGITPHVRPGGKNTLAVQADNTNEACRGGAGRGVPGQRPAWGHPARGVAACDGRTVHPRQRLHLSEHMANVCSGDEFRAGGQAVRARAGDAGQLAESVHHPAVGLQRQRRQGRVLVPRGILAAPERGVAQSVSAVRSAGTS
jgi:hypothetical protein